MPGYLVRVKPAPSGRRLSRQFPPRQPWLDFIFNECRQIAGAGNGKVGASLFKGARIMGAGFTNTNRPGPRIGAFLDPGGDVIGLDHSRRRVDIGLVHAVIDQKRRRPAADVFGIRNDVKPDAVLFFQGAIDGVTGFFWISRITANQDTIGL